MKTFYEVLEEKLKEEIGPDRYEREEKVERAIEYIADILIEELKVQNPYGIFPQKEEEESDPDDNPL